MEKNIKRMFVYIPIYVCITESLYYTAEVNIIL